MKGEVKYGTNNSVLHRGLRSTDHQHGFGNSLGLTEHYVPDLLSCGQTADFMICAPTATFVLERPSMKEYEITFHSCNSENYSKRITVCIIEPHTVSESTGIMHFAHGWAGNRFQYDAMMKDFANRYDLICIATEYRQSGYDFDPATGRGACMPYDFSHFQVIDCLNSLRTVIGMYPRINKKRIITFGGSQGGHISMLMAAFCPNTFALAISACGISHVTPSWQKKAGRSFSEDDLAVRDVVRMASRIQCPVVLIHGMSDETVPDDHTRMLQEALRSTGKDVRVKYYKGAGHMLQPVTDRRSSTVELANDLLQNVHDGKQIDFDAESRICIECVNKKFIIDWSKPPNDHTLIQWEEKE